MARPTTTLTPALIDELTAYMARGASLTAACEFLGVRPGTAEEWLQIAKGNRRKTGHRPSALHKHFLREVDKVRGRAKLAVEIAAFQSATVDRAVTETEELLDVSGNVVGTRRRTKIIPRDPVMTRWQLEKRDPAQYGTDVRDGDGEVRVTIVRTEHPLRPDSADDVGADGVLARRDDDIARTRRRARRA
jgi:hypothetical protein